MYIQFGQFLKGRGHGMPKINSVGWHTYHHTTFSQCPVCLVPVCSGEAAASSELHAPSSYNQITALPCKDDHSLDLTCQGRVLLCAFYSMDICTGCPGGCSTYLPSLVLLIPAAQSVRFPRGHVFRRASMSQLLLIASISLLWHCFFHQW